MDPEMLQAAIASSKEALKTYYKGEKKYFQEIAAEIKKEFDEKYKGTWHCVVGKNFGSFVSHEVQKMVFLEFSSIKVLLYRHG